MKEELTTREHEIFNMLLDGTAPKEIAYSLNISYQTVLFHQKKIYRKLEVHSINELLINYSTAHAESDNAGSSVQENSPIEARTAAMITAPEKIPNEAFENSLKKKINMLAGKKEFLQKSAVLSAVILFIMFGFLHEFNLKGKIIVPNPIVITFTDDGPLGSDGPRGWQYIIDRDLFFYHGEWRKSPYRQKREKVIEGDIFDISYAFISDADIGFLEAGFFDSLAGGNEGYYWTLLSGNQKLLKDIKAGVKYRASISLAITKTATCEADIANRFFLVAGPKTENNPTLTFSQFDITKH